MSIQNRLLLIYTIIFSGAFVLFAMIVYFLPSNRILAEMDADLQALAGEITPGNLNIVPDRNGSFRVTIPNDLDPFKTASTFIVIVDKQGRVLVRSNNLTELTNC